LSATLAHHHNDIEKYLIFIKNNLQMITSKTYSRKNQGLITYILQQLELTTNPILLHQVQDLHIQYQENKLPKYTPQKLVCDIEDKIRVLKHAEAWTTLHVPEQPMMAMHTPIRYSTKRIPSQSNCIQTKETFPTLANKMAKMAKEKDVFNTRNGCSFPLLTKMILKQWMATLTLVHQMQQRQWSMGPISYHNHTHRWLKTCFPLFG